MLALGVLEAFLTWWRRWIQSNAVLNVETAMRRDLYAHLQALPMSFHGRWQIGQLISRATTDLSSIRRFFGFGMLFLFINILQVTAVAVVLLTMYWPLGLVVVCTAAPIVWLSMRFEKEYVVVSRRVQDEQGDLATRAEEAAVAIRVIKSFGRSRYISDQYEAGARQLHATSMEKVRLSARFWTFLEVIPNLAVVVVLLFGAIGVGRGVLTPGELVAFITLMLSLVWPVSSLGIILAMAQEAMTSAARILEIFDTESDIVSGTRTIDAAPWPPALRARRLRLPRRARRAGAARRQPRHPAGRDGRRGRCDRHRQVQPDRARAAAVRRDRRRGHDRRRRRARPRAGPPAPAGRDRVRRPDALLDERAREPHPRPGRRAPTPRSRRRSTSPRPASPATCRGASTPGSASRGWRSPAASGSDSRSPARCCREPAVLVLDDTLSALDVHTEALVEEALRRVLVDTTGVIVAHRASTVLLADRVALLQGGTITHVGEHRELLATVPAYRELLAADPSLEEAAL